MLVAVLTALLCNSFRVDGAAAKTCTAEDIAAAVDAAGAALREYNGAARPRLETKLARLGKKKGWPKEESNERGLKYLQDGRTAELDEKANELLVRIDTLGRPAQVDQLDCSALGEIKSAGGELLAVMKSKTAYMTDKLDRELGVAPRVAAAPSPPPRQPAPIKAKPVEEKGAPVPAPTKPWDTTTAHAPPDDRGKRTADLPPPPAHFAGPEDGYSLEEIRDATKGFFGTISTNLGVVLEKAFSISGKPTAYVLGKEGGGAFLAGVRYGEGTLYMRGIDRRRKVYWHGPSIGTDFGGAGSRTLFLIYKLERPDDLNRVFTGVDGSAYVVGGIGLTVMKGGPIVLTPIRSGIGLRLGANIGYVRFTPRKTWNPF